MIVTLSGVTGTGKSFFKNTISEELCFKNLVIVTTREKRIGEVNGIDKEFVSEEEFEKLKKEKQIVVDFEFLGSKYAYRKADLDENIYSVHTLRHTCATILYKAGCNIRTIQEILGHVQIDTTEIYTHLHDQEVMDVMLNHPLAQYKMADALAYCA